MQMKKAGVVATGALAAVAIMGAPAAAASTTDASALTHGTSLTEGKASAMRMVGANQLNLARGGWQGGWDAPWDVDPQALVSTLNGTAISTLPIQSCGSTAAFAVGAAAPITSPNTVVAGGFHEEGYGHDKGDKLACANSNVSVTQSDEVPVTAIGNNTVVVAGALQACGSTASFAAGVAIPITSPNTVIGGCDNGNVSIEEEDEWDQWGGSDKWGGSHKSDGYGKWSESARTEGTTVSTAAARQGLVAKVAGLKKASMKLNARGPQAAPQVRGGFGWDAPWDVDPFGVLATANGTSIQTALLQACGSTAAFAVGITAPITSPNTVIGDCKNSNVKIDQKDTSALTYAANNTAVVVAPIQACGSTASAGIGAAAPITSPNTVIGSCYNANIVID
ncbi:hypothetical protein QEZ54_32000 [Catellatospora sp. KI3]|uniref:hypothetical protein n=1 Tax=Catellatospora sp. KI3 TaxID=3041620 RepID=UPI0024827E6C|nr:hypothetical protein [Catellatospora sp. KI3]MDI1465603.1 hypothetical protein [Catellatospora sp. KI3]